MDLRDYFRILRRSWILVVSFTLGGILAAGWASMLIKPTYSSETQLFVAAQTSGSLAELQQGNTFSQARVQSYVKTVTTPIVLQPAIDSLGLSVSPADLASRIKASADINTVLIYISVSDTSPVQAAAIAQAVAVSLIDVVDDLEKPKSGGASAVTLSVITPAQAPDAPSAPNTHLNLMIGLVLGLALGVTAAILKMSLDNRVRSEADFRGMSEAPVLGGIAFDADATKKPLLTQAPPQGPRAESYRQLRTNLSFTNLSGKAKTILVTSSLPGEGKTTTATNLAIALAQAGQTVCLIDADLRRPMVSEYLGLDRTVGLTTSLVGDADVHEILQPWGDDNLYVLPSGNVPPNPSELLGSEEMRQLLSRLESSFDTIIIDTPPLLPVTDAAVLSQHVGGVVLVVGAQRLKTQDLAKSFQALEMVDANLLGVVLNQLPTRGPDAYAYTYYNSEDSSGNRNHRAANYHTAVDEPEALSQPEFGAGLMDAGMRPPSAFPRL